ncbi:YdcF family protein [Neobacillus sp. D3-1R]|uniref:YdcF family protein n=1 Tax=Neobacillus sp. D3-1R TaxID=3445778 RepID=UPI003F9FB5E4
MIKRKKVRLIIGLLFLCVVIYFGSLHLKIRENIDSKAPNNVDYLIILGARVKGTIPSLALQYRIDKAAEYLTNNPNTIAIASGGQGEGEDITEAEAIKIGLMEQNITSTRIILEDKSTDTVENIYYSKKVIPNSSKTGILVTNDFHIYRAKQIARDQGLLVHGLPAKTPVVALFKSYSREYLAITKYYLYKYII